MIRWRISLQKKDQTKIIAIALLKTDKSNISEQEFRTTVIKILAGLERSIEDTRETLAAEIKDLKTSQAEILKCYNQDAKLIGCNDCKDRRSRGMNK